MNNQLSTPRPIKSGAYKQNRSVFFEPSKLFLAQITELYDDVWPTVTAIQYFRDQVNDYCNTTTVKDNPTLVRKFAKSTDKTNRPNLARFCIQDTMEEIKQGIARNLLINLFAYYEAWVEEMLGIICCNSQKNRMAFQYPSGKQKNNYIVALSNICNSGCQVLIDSYYNQYQNNKLYSLTAIDYWLHYYRYYKELRNSIAHGGGVVDQKLVNAYNDIISRGFTKNDLIVDELPAIDVPVIGTAANYSLREIVWLSQILIRLVVTFDVEFIKSNKTEDYFCNEIKKVYQKKRKLPQTEKEKTKLSRSLSGTAFFKRPTDEMKIYNLLIINGVL